MSQPHPDAVDVADASTGQVALPGDHWSLAADVAALLGSWTRGSAADAVIGEDRSGRAWEELSRSVDRAVDECLSAPLQRAQDRGERVPLRPTWVVVRTVRGLLVSGLLGRPVDPAQVPDLVGRVLLSLLHRGLHPV